ncbi:MAG: T9SS type A sorting domain-containing protein [Flavobacteriales bacterium]
MGGNEIQGTVFSDTDNDGALDEGESGIQNAMVITQPGNVITSSSNSGAYRTWVSAGDFTVEPIPQLYQSFTGSPRSVSFADVGLIDTGNDLGLLLEPNVQDLRATGFSTPPRPGFQNLLWLSHRNVGTVPTNAVLRLTFDAQQTFVAAEPPPTSVSGNLIEWDLATEVGELPRTFSIHLFTPADVPLGTELSYTVEADPVATDETPEDNSITIIEPVIGSFDPNDKHVEPGSLTPAEVLERKKLDYTIRFQNTGTYLAENALITDFLSEDLDPMTFEFVGSSHPCEWYISNGQLQFQFEGIMLPDSISNEPESHGFVRFQIAARPDLQLGETVSNSASIHFDFNTPVVTDPAVFSVEEVTAVQEPRTDRLALYPNPVEQTLWISGTHQGNVRAVEVMDLSGRVVLRSTAYAAGAAIDVSTLPSGMYHVRATAVEGLLSGRFVKR